MKCTKCGQELPNGAVFCSNCGQKVEAQPNTLNINLDEMSKTAALKVNELADKAKPVLEKVSKTNVTINGKKLKMKSVGLIGLAILALILCISLFKPKAVEPSIRKFEKTMDRMIEEEKFGGLEFKTNSGTDYYGEESMEYSSYQAGANISFYGMYSSQSLDDEFMFAYLSELSDEKSAKEVYKSMKDEFFDTVENPDLKKSSTSTSHYEQFSFRTKTSDNKAVFQIIRKKEYVLVIAYGDSVPEKDINELLKGCGMDR